MKNRKGSIGLIIMYLISMCLLTWVSLYVEKKKASKILSKSVIKTTTAYFEKVTDSTVSLVNYRLDGSMAAGAGVVLEDNLVLTAAHVIRDNGIVHALTAQGDQYTVDYIYADEELDLAILEFRKAIKATSSKISKTDSKVGDVVYVCGFSYAAFPQNLSKGIISNLDIVWDELPRLSCYGTDALIVGGNSGGPWYNEAGEIVSITSWGAGPSGNLGFGVPRETIESFLDMYWTLR